MLSFSVRMIRDKWKTSLIFLGGLTMFLEMFISFYPFIQEKAGDINELVMTALPKDIFKVFNLEASLISFSSFESYLSTKYYSMIWPILIIILAISLANYLVLDEISKGTAESTFSLPVSRIKIFLQRYLTGLTMIVMVSAISVLATPILAEIHGIDYILTNYLIFIVECALFSSSVYSLTVLVSMFFIDKGRSNMVVGGFLVIMYVMSVITLMKNNLDWLKYFSFFHYFDATDVIVNGKLTEYSIPVLIAFMMITSLLSLYKFNKRDLAV